LKKKPKSIQVHDGDLGPGVDFGRLVAVDTETQGLNLARDRLCLAQLAAALGARVRPVFCTKIASKLVRTYTSGHGLKDVCRELLGVDLSKEQQSSDWAAPTLSAEQLDYAAADVLYLHEIKGKLEAMLEREGRTALAKACFDFLATRSELDLLGWGDEDVFAH